VTLAAGLARALVSLGVSPGDAVGVACSGGADSVALLHLLRRIHIDLDITVLHVDHGLRPDSAEHSEFVAEIATTQDLKFEVLPVRIEPGDSIEAAARKARYTALDGAAQRRGLRFVATAHTRDDQTETVLLRLMRGGSLAGIAPTLGIFVRPLLDVRRKELREWLLSEGLEWREDPTNADLRFERNWTRNLVLPLLRERRAGIDEVLARTADRSRADEEALAAMAAEVLHRSDVDDVGIFIDAADFDLQPLAIRSRVAIGALHRLGADPRRTDIEAIVGSSPGSVRCGAVSVWHTDRGLSFIREPVPVPDPLRIGADEHEGSWGLRVRVGSSKAESWRWRCPVPEGVSTLSIRSRLAGDRVLTAGGTKKVQDVLVDAKVLRPLRDLVPILAVGDEALAVVGLTRRPEETATVIDIEPSSPTWSRGAVWSRT
jgi:tRNA(Ile)-lysidine synthase